MACCVAVLYLYALVRRGSTAAWSWLRRRPAPEPTFAPPARRTVTLTG
jgi:hypothetical protein